MSWLNKPPAQGCSTRPPQPRDCGSEYVNRQLPQLSSAIRETEWECSHSLEWKDSSMKAHCYRGLLFKMKERNPMQTSLIPKENNLSSEGCWRSSQSKREMLEQRMKRKARGPERWAHKPEHVVSPLIFPPSSRWLLANGMLMKPSLRCRCVFKIN